MKMQPEASWIEKMAQGIGLIPDLTESETPKSEMREPGPPVSYTHLRAHETTLHLVCRLLLEKKK